MLENSENVLAIELMSAAQGLDCGKGLTPGRGVELAYDCIRRDVPPLHEDRFLAPDIESIAKLVRSGRIVDSVQASCGLKLCKEQVRAGRTELCHRSRDLVRGGARLHV